jgi:hypothetical protein
MTQEPITKETDECPENDGESHVVHPICIHCNIAFD